jgi:hypothetical protein
VAEGGLWGWFDARPSNSTVEKNELEFVVGEETECRLGVHTRYRHEYCDTGKKLLTSMCKGGVFQEHVVVNGGSPGQDCQTWDTAVNYEMAIDKGVALEELAKWCDGCQEDPL